MESNVLFGLMLALCTTVVVLQPKRSHGWRKIAESVPFLVPLFIGGSRGCFPGTRGVVLVLLILYTLGALSMMVVKWRRR